MSIRLKVASKDQQDDKNPWSGQNVCFPVQVSGAFAGPGPRGAHTRSLCGCHPRRWLVVEKGFMSLSNPPQTTYMLVSYFT